MTINVPEFRVIYVTRIIKKWTLYVKLMDVSITWIALNEDSST